MHMMKVGTRQQKTERMRRQQAMTSTKDEGTKCFKIKSCVSAEVSWRSDVSPFFFFSPSFFDYILTSGKRHSWKQNQHLKERLQSPHKGGKEKKKGFRKHKMTKKKGEIRRLMHLRSESVFNRHIYLQAASSECAVHCREKGTQRATLSEGHIYI